MNPTERKNTPKEYVILYDVINARSVVEFRYFIIEGSDKILPCIMNITKKERFGLKEIKVYELGKKVEADWK